MPNQVDLFLNLPEPQHKDFKLLSPESVWPPLLHNWLVPLVLECFSIEHVEEVELDVDGDGGPLPRFIGSCPLPDYQLLKVSVCQK